MPATTTRAPQNPNAVPKSTLEFSLAAGTARVDFRELEIPSTLDSLGGHKLFALLQFTDGSRVIQTFGNVPVKAMRWRGVILGQESFDRAKALDGMRRTRAQVTLTYGPFRFTGILAAFLVRPGFEGFLPYDAEFVPDTDLSQSVPPGLVALVDTAASQALDAALAATNAFAIDQDLIPEFVFEIALNLQAAVVQATTAILTAGALTALAAKNPGQLGQITQTLAAANAALNDGNGGGILNTAIFSLTSDAPTAIDPTVAPDIFNAWAACNAALALLQTPTPPAALTVTVLDPNLYQLATVYLGDPSRWDEIAAANQVDEPFLVGLWVLVIPNA